jgi:nitronate monooxygenase
MFVEALQRRRKPKCDKGYVLFKDAEGKLTRCLAKERHEEFFCICNGLLSSSGYNPDKEEPLYTVGSNAYRIDRIVSVRALMDELTGKGTDRPA